MKLIDKSALVAEIENRRAEISDACQGYIADKKMAAEYILLNELLDFINTLEVKEVDLEKESLTWEDIPKILSISSELKTSWWFRDKTKDIGTQIFWEEVLKRFKEKKEEKV